MPPFDSLSPPDKAKVCFFKAAELHKNNQLEQALKLYAQAVAYNPDFPDAYTNMAVALRKQKHFAAALACYQRSLTLRPDHSGTYSNMGNVLNDLDRISEALDAHAKAVELEPDNLLYLYNKALAHRDALNLDTAIALFNEVLQKNPAYRNCRWDRALTYLMKGDFETGFAEYDSRWELEKSPPRPFSEPRWNGGGLGKRRLFIHREQGFGDAIQFARLLPALKKRYGGTLILECQPELVSLFIGLEGVDHVHPFGQPLPQFDTWIPLMSLAHILKIDEDNIPGEVPYLSGPAESRFHIRPAPENGLNIALAWAGSPTHQNDRRRSAGLSKFLSLGAFNGVTLFSLQKGPCETDLKAEGGEALIINAAAEVKDFSDTAAIVEQMDLIISVDTSLVHLAGALGKEVWCLLPYTPDWRWMVDRTDSPWYPTLRLFRQETPGDWDGVFDAVIAALQEKLGA